MGSITALFHVIVVTYKNNDKGNMMTTTTNPRMTEIKNIWQQYQGLYVVGGILIGLLLFPFLELIIKDLSQLLIGLIPEAIGIGFTVFFLDRIYQERDIKQLKQRLRGEASSQSNDTSKSAVDWMRRDDWLTGDDGLLKGANLNNANLNKVDFSNANLKDASLSWADLQGANLFEATLQDADLQFINLEGAYLRDANIEGADLSLAKMEGARLPNANLKDASLSGTYLQKTNLFGVNFQNADLYNAHLEGADLRSVNLDKARLIGATLPDGTKWTPETDMGRFTDPEHPNFWQPPEKE